MIFVARRVAPVLASLSAAGLAAALGCAALAATGCATPPKVTAMTRRIEANPRAVVEGRVRDLDPQAPTHVLVVPRAHLENAAALAAADPGALAELVRVAAEVAAKDGLGNTFRLVFNTGAEAGQSVFHTHLHLLGGRPMTWPPG